MAFETKRLSGAPNAIAPDGSEVRTLCRVERGSMAQFTLPPGAVSRAVANRTVEELWCFVAGRGRMWRRLGEREEVTQGLRMRFRLQIWVE
jgi:mannose-6-phosphate isomerase-like protein (cupin superfamily)